MSDLISALGLTDQNTDPAAHAVVSATVAAVTTDGYLCQLRDNTEAFLPSSEHIHSKPLNIGDTMNALILRNDGRPVLSLARIELIEALYAGISPEIRNGHVRIMGISRAPGVRSKVAVASTTLAPDLDAVASCVGREANRVRWVGTALGGERLDIIAWHPDPTTFLRNALAPAEIGTITIDGNHARCEAPAHQMSAAVGGGGLNSVLAGQLVGLMVEIVPAS